MCVCWVDLHPKKTDYYQKDGVIRPKLHSNWNQHTQLFRPFSSHTHASRPFYLHAVRWHRTHARESAAQGLKWSS